MLRRALTVLVLCPFLLGCETMPWKSSSEDDLPPVELLDDSAAGLDISPAAEPGLPLSVSQRFPDVPIPANTKEDLARSYVFESPTLQIGRMVYTTRSSLNELAQFYIRECPAADWKLENSLQAENIQLVFLKPGKRLVVTASRQGPGRANLLVVNLTPDTAAGSGL